MPVRPTRDCRSCGARSGEGRHPARRRQRTSPSQHPATGRALCRRLAMDLNHGFLQGLGEARPYSSHAPQERPRFSRRSLSPTQRPTNFSSGRRRRARTPRRTRPTQTPQRTRPTQTGRRRGRVTGAACPCVRRDELGVPARCRRVPSGMPWARVASSKALATSTRSERSSGERSSITVAGSLLSSIARVRAPQARLSRLPRCGSDAGLAQIPARCLLRVLPGPPTCRPFAVAVVRALGAYVMNTTL
jgi:hypothetical protein